MKNTRRATQLLVLLLALTLTVAVGCSDDATDGNNGTETDARVDDTPDAAADDADVDDEDTSDADDEDTSTSDASDGGGDAADDAADDVGDATDDAGDATDDAGDAGDDGGDAADGADAADADPAPKGCVGSALTGTTLQLDPTGTLGQLYVRAAFDGSGVWVVYASREASGSGNEDIFALRVLCDGTVAAGPTRVTSTPVGIRDYQPSIDVHDGTVYIVWTSEDENTGVKTLQYRTYRIDGAPLMTASADVTPEDSGGAAISEMIWEPDVAGLPTGGAAITASYDSQIVVQKVDDDGNLVGSAIQDLADTEARQIKPVIASVAGDTVWVSWGNQSPAWAGPMEVVYSELDLNNPQQQTRTTLGATASSGVLNPIGEPIRSPDDVFITYTSNTAQGVHVANAASASHIGADVDASGYTYNMRSSVATDTGGGAVAWYGGATPSAFSVLVQPFTYTSSSLSLGTRMEIPLFDSANAAHAPYGPAIVNAGTGIYFVAWPEGAAANEAQVMGRFIQP